MNIEESDLQKLLEAIDNKKLSIPEAIALINGKMENNKPLQSTDDIKLTVDYTKTVDQAIADGKYGWKNSDITAKHFPISPEMIGTKVEISGKLFHFNRSMSSEDVIKEMDKDGYRPAVLMEALALAAAYPELQRRFPIIALGSVWRVSFGNRRVPCLLVDGYDRKLFLYYFGNTWVAQVRFFGIRK